MNHPANDLHSLTRDHSRDAAGAGDDAGPLVYCRAMVRNEADIIRSFLAHGEALFDKTVLVDVQSTDGTAEIIEASVRAAPGRIVRFNCRTQERYQSALMNTLARQAFSEGADWVFCSMPTSFSTSRAGTNFTDPAIHLPGSI
jgi:hypothetical protein